MEQVWEALIDLANVKEASSDNQTKTMSANTRLMKLKDIQCVAVPIAPVSTTYDPSQSSPDFPGKF
jgi:hypothetical protein